ncbi:hypothetical protein [Myroides phaeus]|uniref:Uncharacterized protein n=1 Tax=Myroides phaeus TaxID=702745 RepID=A0A1G8DI43_9FLAO|nr:hypothetical protein [Myroides phaeus]MEC4117088.1 hypothetical protein [Myroides phaeus]SDH57316.1 hypothetical protein SAMN05421818_10729 [Myroides phaeus]
MKQLQNTDAKKVFKVPEDYFKNLEQRVFDQLENAPKESKVIPLKRNRFIWVAAASVVALLALTLTFKFEKSTKIEKESLENYLEYNQSYSLSNDIINALDEDDIQEIENSININQTQIDHYVLSHIDIEYYLNE